MSISSGFYFIYAYKGLMDHLREHQKIADSIKTIAPQFTRQIMPPYFSTIIESENISDLKSEFHYITNKLKLEVKGLQKEQLRSIHARIEPIFAHGIGQPLDIKVITKYNQSTDKGLHIIEFSQDRKNNIKIISQISTERRRLDNRLSLESSQSIFLEQFEDFLITNDNTSEHQYYTKKNAIGYEQYLINLRENLSGHINEIQYNAFTTQGLKNILDSSLEHRQKSLCYLE